MSAAWGRLPEQTPANANAGPARGTVGLLQGCVARVFFARTNEATVRVLSAEGFHVIVPKAARCCGALQMHSGEEEGAKERARATIAAFEACETVAVNAAGCGSTMKEYGRLLASDPEWAERGEAFAAKVKDVTEILAGAEPRAPRHPVPMTVAYHDACHLAHAQKVRDQPRSVLAGIPGAPPDLAAPPAGCRFHPRCPHAMAVCVQTLPLLQETAPGQWTACHLYQRR